MARPRQVTDEQILQTMRDCVLEHGPAVSLDKVAELLSVTPPALIKRFGTRRELMIAALKPPEDTLWLQALEKGPGDGPLQEQLAALMTHFSEFFSRVMPCLHALRESGIPPNELYAPGKPPPPLRGIKAMTRWLELAKKKGLVEGDAPEAASMAIFGAITTRVFAAHLTQTPWSQKSQREYISQLAQFFTRALSPHTHGQSKS